MIIDEVHDNAWFDALRWLNAYKHADAILAELALSPEHRQLIADRFHAALTEVAR